MKSKKLWISLAAIVVLLAGAFAYLTYRNRSLSPSGSETLTSGGMTVTVTYSRPSVRGRVIFGDDSQHPLLPYGKYWRLGANEATEVTFNRDAVFNDVPVKAGTYRMYAIPGPETFVIRLNSELGKWGAFEPDYKLDVLETKVPVEKTSSPVEVYTISLAPEGNGIKIIFEWSDTRFVVPLKPQ
jgi:hypothetical protein